jgi:hypothetical protein
MAKTTNVALSRQHDGKRVEFEVSHAERILQMPNSGWELPKDSEFELKDGSITPRNTGKDKKA